MAATYDSTGLTIQTFDEQLSEITEAFRQSFGSGIRVDLQSSFGQLIRILSTLSIAEQENQLAFWQGVDPRLSEGVALDRAVSWLGVVRLPEAPAEVTGPAAGTPATVISNGVQWQHNPTTTTWVVIGGPYTIGGGGAIDIRLQGEALGENAIAVDPETGFDDWTLLSVVPGLSTFEAAAQPIAGRDLEPDAQLRARAEVERYRRGQGPLQAIRASLSAVAGVTYSRVGENTSLVTDADGVTGKAIHAVVEGGADAEVALAIWNSKPAGIEAYGTDVVTTIVDDIGLQQPVAFDRVSEITLHIRATLTTSTSEETFPPDGEDASSAALLAYANANLTVGSDVLPYRFSGAIFDAEIPGIDNVVVERSTDGVSWFTTKLAVGVTSRAVLTDARITIVQD